MPKNTGGRRASARSAAFRPGGNSSTNHKPLFDMNVMSLHARKNVNAAAVTAAAVTRTTNTLFLNANGITAYIINHRDSVISSGDNPTLYLRRGQTYIFENKSTSVHKFRISVTVGGDNYDNGIVGDEAAGPTGKLTFNVPADAPDTLYYYCTASGHGNMKGTINIID